jgi:DNA processing protein
MDLPCLAATAPGFPPRLLDIPDPPSALWIRGRREALARTAVAIVGSRRASPTSLDIARRLARDLAGAGLVIVSGLARGCDAAAHQGALDAGGRTVAVLGSGLDVLYPPEHGGLAGAIAEAGAVVSEFPPGTPPLPNHFRLRNRIISGLAHGVVVIEANEKSGSLITAGCALTQGREVMVVPGTVVAGRNRGGHQLIRDGATLVETAEDVLAALVAAVPLISGATPSAAEGRAPIAGDAVEPDDAVLAALDPVDGQDLDALAARTGLAGPAILVRLAELELTGLAVRHPGGRFVRSAGKVIT